MPRFTPLVRAPLVAALCASLLFLAGCGGGGGGGSTPSPAGIGAPPTLLQAAFDGSAYTYGHDSIPQLPVVGAPADTDFSRWAMFHDGTGYRLCFFRAGQAAIYQFGYDARTGAYVHGHEVRPEALLIGIPAGADTASFKMLHDGRDTRLYLRGTDRSVIHQFAYDATRNGYVFGFRSIATIGMSGAPADADYGRWAMLFDGSVYRQYVGKRGTTDQLYQFGFDGRTYAFGHQSIPQIAVRGMPSEADTGSFAMLHDGDTYRLYHMTR